MDVGVLPIRPTTAAAFRWMKVISSLVGRPGKVSHEPVHHTGQGKAGGLSLLVVDFRTRWWRADCGSEVRSVV